MVGKFVRKNLQKVRGLQGEMAKGGNPCLDFSKQVLASPQSAIQRVSQLSLGSFKKTVTGDNFFLNPTLGTSVSSPPK